MIDFNDDQKTLIKLFSNSQLVNQFYLTGGTALSIFYLHHRLSIDLDFFSEKPFSYNELSEFLDQIKEKFNIEEVPAVKIYDRWRFEIGKKNPVKLEFVYFNHEKKRLKPLKKRNNIFIDSLEDIAANKTLAYFDRNEPKDLFDLYFLINKAGFSILKLLSMVQEKFGIRFSEFGFWSESTKSLKLFDSLKPLIVDEDSNRLIEDIKTFFLEQGRKNLNRNLN